MTERDLPALCLLEERREPFVRIPLAEGLIVTESATDFVEVRDMFRLDGLPDLVPLGTAGSLNWEELEEAFEPTHLLCPDRLG